MDICCWHCGAERANLHRFTESAGFSGDFQVVRCLLCGWQVSRLVPWHRRPLPNSLAVDEPDELEELEERLLTFASEAFFDLDPYLGASF